MYEKHESIHILFTKRTESVKHHKGQISFPGGAADEGDDELSVTALRETQEEVGIQTRHVEIIAELDDMITPTGFRVTPFVGCFSYPYDFSINPGEIAELIEVPLQHLLDPANYRTGTREFRGKTYEIHYYRIRRVYHLGSYRIHPESIPRKTARAASLVHPELLHTHVQRAFLQSNFRAASALLPSDCSIAYRICAFSSSSRVCTSALGCTPDELGPDSRDNSSGQISQVQFIPDGNHHHAVDQIFEFANIAGPGIAQHVLEYFWVKRHGYFFRVQHCTA